MLADVTTSGWRPRLADATVPGILIVTFYLIVAVACAWALSVARIGAQMAKEYRKVERRRHDRTTASRASFLFWALLTLCMVILGVNKYLDLESWLTELGRNIALSQGWYEARSGVQRPLVAAVAGLGLISLTVLLVLTRRLLPRHVPAFVGVVVLLCFVIARAMSFHQLDDALATELLGVRVRSLLELGGILCIGLCAVKNCWWYWPGRLGARSPECTTTSSVVPTRALCTGCRRCRTRIDLVDCAAGSDAQAFAAPCSCVRGRRRTAVLCHRSRDVLSSAG